MCETRPASQRPGTFFYGNSPNSPALTHFSLAGAVFSFYALDRSKNDLARRFAIQAILHQPLDYVRVVARDGARYFAPSMDTRPWSGPGPAIYDFRGPPLESESWLQEVMSHRYRDTPIRRRPVLLAVVGAYASLVRFNGIVLAVALSAAFVGIARAADPSLRAVLYMLFAAAAALYLLPVIMSCFDYRYGFPGQVPLGWGAVLGGWVTARQWRYPKAAPIATPEA